MLWELEPKAFANVFIKQLDYESTIKHRNRERIIYRNYWSRIVALGNLMFLKLALLLGQTFVLRTSHFRGATISR